MTARETSFGESRPPTVVDRFGVWLSKRQIQRTVGRLDGRDVADFGCGFQAKTMRQFLPVVGSATLVDLSLAPDLAGRARVRAIEGSLPDCLDDLPDASLDV